VAAPIPSSTGDGKVDLFDFFLFADAFGSTELAKLLAVARRI
jgi:hypothetical protein